MAMVTMKSVSSGQRNNVRSFNEWYSTDIESAFSPPRDASDNLNHQESSTHATTWIPFHSNHFSIATTEPSNTTTFEDDSFHNEEDGSYDDGSIEDLHFSVKHGGSWCYGISLHRCIMFTIAGFFLVTLAFGINTIAMARKENGGSNSVTESAFSFDLSPNTAVLGGATYTVLIRDDANIASDAPPLCVSNGSMDFCWQQESNGNLKLFQNNPSNMLWESNIALTEEGPYFTRLQQGDGNFVTRRGTPENFESKSVWNSRKSQVGSPNGFFIAMHNDLGGVSIFEGSPEKANNVFLPLLANSLLINNEKYYDILQHNIPIMAGTPPVCVFAGNANVCWKQEVNGNIKLYQDYPYNLLWESGFISTEVGQYFTRLQEGDGNFLTRRGTPEQYEQTSVWKTGKSEVGTKEGFFIALREDYSGIFIINGSPANPVGKYLELVNSRTSDRIPDAVPSSHPPTKSPSPTMTTTSNNKKLPSQSSCKRGADDFGPPDVQVPEEPGCIIPKVPTPEEGIFKPLVCNTNIDAQSCTTTSWTSRFSSSPIHSNEVLIPCGECIYMDHPGPTLSLSGGLDIQGKLVFPENYSGLTIDTPYIRIQGELHMRSSKPVSGQEDVKFILTGVNGAVTQFVPADSNAEVCGPNGCEVGKKPVVVAGGKLHIEGLPDNTPTWLNLYDVLESGTLVKNLVVSNSIKNKWAVGAEIMISSHTTNYDDEQIRRIVNIVDHTVAGHVVVELDFSVNRPTTILDNPDYAVEVALLSRNIVFEGAKDDIDNPLHGMHLMIMQTPNVQQKLEGIEVRNGGQQGNLGRYPIHFHMCHNVCGSLVSKNIVRQSNQRCYVVHGTHNLELDSNIAYNTSGHCFMTEDGIEQGNIFRRNLGALTKKVEKIIPNIANNGIETDDEPATYWVTNPMNVFVGNVAAGSFETGFWFDLNFQGVRGPSADLVAKSFKPPFQPLLLFKDNVAHSNGEHGIKTYPGSGYFPREQAVFYHSRAYRNKKAGMHFRNSRNIAIVGGVYADNRRGLDFDAAEEIHVRDVTIIGFSPEFRATAKYFDRAFRCRENFKDYVIGADLQTYTRQNPERLTPLKDFGTVMHNVTFTGFVGTGCKIARPVDFDTKVESKNFDFYSSLSGISVEDDADLPNFCSARSRGVSDIFLTDNDNSFGLPFATSRVAGGENLGASSLIQIDSRMNAFVDQSKCTEVKEGCYNYCKDTCLRGVNFGVSPINSEDYKLKLCNAAGTCVDIKGKYYYDDRDITVAPNTESYKLRYFTAALPPGQYEAVFYDGNNNEVWPTFVQQVYEKAHCSDSLCDGSVVLKTPSLETGDCDNLIRNGDAEDSDIDHTYWLHKLNGVEIVRREGIGGSNALSEIDPGFSKDSHISQYLDSRCLEKYMGSRYEIKAWVKLEKISDGSIYTCDSRKEGSSNCPSVRINHHTVDGDDVLAFSSDVAAEMAFMDAINKDGYQLIRGEVEIKQSWAEASRVLFTIRKANRLRKDIKLFVDNISMVRL